MDIEAARRAMLAAKKNCDQALTYLFEPEPEGLLTRSVLAATPYPDRWKSDTPLHCLARSIRALKPHDKGDGRGQVLFPGYGDLGNNQGPVECRTIDKFGNVRHEYTFPEEQIDDFLPYGDGLMVAGLDRKPETTFGAVYILENGTWTERRIPGARHLSDVAFFDGRGFVIAQIEGLSALMWTRDWMGWTPVLKAVKGTAYYRLLALEDRLLVFCTKKVEGIKFGDRRWYSIERGSHTLTPLDFDAYPGLQGRYNWPERRFRFGGVAIYTSAVGLSHSSFQLGHSVYATDGNTARRIANVEPPEFVRDVVRGNDGLYMLTCLQEEPPFRSKVWRSRDLDTWSLVADFEIEALPTRLAIMDGRLWIGTGTRYTKAGYLADKAAGNVYVLEP